MNKKVQFKVILIFFLIVIILIGGIGVYTLNSLNQLYFSIESNQLNDLDAIETHITNIQSNIIFALVGTGIALAVIGVLLSMFLSKFVVYPINKLIKGADKIKEEGSKNKRSTKAIHIDNLDDVIGKMTNELEEKLSEVSTQKNQIETILLHMTDGIIAFNMAGEIILINPAAKKFLEVRPEDNMFNDIFRRFKININMEKIIYLENWTSTEQRIQIGDTYMNIFFAPFKNESDRPNGVIAVIQDITEHVKLDNMQKEFVADVSHELKTPITSIMGYADTLLEGDYDRETQSKFLGVIATEARRMARLVTDLLTLSRYDNNKKRTQKDSFDLGELVKKCQDKLAIEIKKKNHQVNCFVTADVPPVYADKYDIERVVLNILTNSIKYTKDGGEIKIYVGFVYNDAYIKVFDNGMGIPEEDLNRIFERFYRVDKARTREMGGTGLGLSIAKEILDKNGGSIDIKSVVGEGTEVVVRIPTKENEKKL